jgi:hypothetical protein
MYPHAARVCFSLAAAILLLSADTVPGGELASSDLDRRAFSASVNISGSVRISREFTETRLAVVRHSRCNHQTYWYSVGGFCFATDQRPDRVVRHETRPLESGRLAPDQCFQVIGQTTQPGPTANCLEISLLYKECATSFVPSDFYLGCARGVSPGTPVDLVIEGTTMDAIPIPAFSNTAVFSRSQTWHYPTQQIPQGATDVSYRFVVTVAETVSGKAIVLDDQHRSGGGFRLEFPEESGVVILLQEPDQRSDDFRHDLPDE